MRDRNVHVRSINGHFEREQPTYDGRYLLADIRRVVGGIPDGQEMSRLITALKSVRKGITDSDGSTRDTDAGRILDKAITYLESLKGTDLKPTDSVEPAGRKLKSISIS